MKTIVINNIEFPKEITLTYSKKGDREWFEWWEGEKKGIVIQRYKNKHSHIIFFGDKRAMTYSVHETITEAIKDLGSLGFKVKLAKNWKIILIKYDNKENGK
jgi:hypothetical protein